MSSPRSPSSTTISYDRMDSLLHKNHLNKDIETKPTAWSAFYGFLEMVETYAFLVVGCVSWYFVVILLLRWLRFPFDAYLTEVFLIIVTPMFLMAILLKVLDRMVAASKED